MLKDSQSRWRSWYGNTIFDGPQKHVGLLEQLLDISNNPAIRAEVQLVASKQCQRARRLSAMTVTKSQRMWNVCNRRQKTLLKDYAQYNSQTPEERQTVQNQISHTNLFLFFLVNYFIIPRILVKMRDIYQGFIGQNCNLTGQLSNVQCYVKVEH